MAKDKSAEPFVKTPHVEWTLNQLRWRWLLDSWEGGEAYRMAVYGFDIHGMPERHREEVKKLREEAADLYAETQAENLTGNNLLVFLATQTEVDSALNCLDPDCIAKAPPKVPEAAKKAE
jgi:hypothetical protein